MRCTVHPRRVPGICRFNQAETISTIRFGSSAKTIKNKPRVNVTKSVKELEDLLEAANKQLHRQGVVMDTQRRCIEQYQALLRKHKIEDTVNAQAGASAGAAVSQGLSPLSESSQPSESTPVPTYVLRSVSHVLCHIGGAACVRVRPNSCSLFPHPDCVVVHVPPYRSLC